MLHHLPEDVLCLISDWIGNRFLSHVCMQLWVILHTCAAPLARARRTPRIPPPHCDGGVHSGAGTFGFPGMQKYSDLQV